MIVINSHYLGVIGLNTLTRWRFDTQMRWDGYQGLDARETPYSKNGCASGPQLVHPHRRKKESSRDFFTKFPAPGRTKNAERLFCVQPRFRKPEASKEVYSPLGHVET